LPAVEEMGKPRRWMGEVQAAGVSFGCGFSA